MVPAKRAELRANDGKRAAGNEGRRAERPAPREEDSQGEIASYGTLPVPLIDSK